MNSDAEQYGPLVDKLVGSEFKLTLAVNSIKLRFGAHANPKGTHYIWIDPPWEFHGPTGLITTSSEYRDETFQEWGKLFDPIREGILESWSTAPSNSVRFQFAAGLYLIVPVSTRDPEPDDWYTNWYAWDRAIAD